MYQEFSLDYYIRRKIEFQSSQEVQDLQWCIFPWKLVLRLVGQESEEEVCRYNRIG
jgi:hypothetical protein